MHHPWAAFHQIVVGIVFVFVSVHFLQQGGGAPISVSNKSFAFPMPKINHQSI
jgi:hypothetical protein